MAGLFGLVTNTVKEPTMPEIAPMPERSSEDLASAGVLDAMVTRTNSLPN